MELLIIIMLFRQIIYLYLYLSINLITVNVYVDFFTIMAKLYPFNENSTSTNEKS